MSESFAWRAWWRFSGRASAMGALAALSVFFLVSALAPFLSNDRPFRLDEDGVRRYPLLRGLDAEDVMWLTAVVALATGWAAWRITALAKTWPHRRRRLVAVTAAALAVLAGTTVASGREPFHETRRYHSELVLRRQLGRLDEVAAAADLSSAEARAQALDGYRAFSDDTLGSLVVNREARERVRVLRRGEDAPRSALAALARTNRRRLGALAAAPFAPNPHSPDHPSFEGIVRPGTDPHHALGTDAQGRDLVALLVHGTRTSFTVALLTVALAATLGVVIGGLAGFCGGRIDWLASRLIETTMCLPVLFVLVVLTAYLPLDERSRPTTIAALLGLVLWTSPARLVRAEVKKTAAEDYVLAARALGASPLRILARHVLPNSMTPLLVSASLTAGAVILIEATLSFLGLGVQDAPSWGRVLCDARRLPDLARAWHLAVFPGLAVFVAVLCFNVVGDGVREAVAPRRE